MGLTFHIVLYQPEIPPNTGNIMRLCAATNAVLHLIHPLGFDFDDKARKRASMDYADHVEIRQWTSWQDFLDHESPARFYFVENKTPRLYTDASFQKGDYLIFGRETKGIPEDLLRAHPERVIGIPMPNPVARSLNLANSVAIVLYEALRQQNK